MIINYVTGHAGTGKSTKLLEHLKSLKPEKTLAMAPTHKALRVLTERLQNDSYNFSTIHSALGWIPGVNEEAEDSNHVDITRKLDKQFEDGITNIIIDEFSMMSEDMLYELTNKIDEFTNYDSDHITLTLYGDPYQLPPVKATPIYTDPATTTHLTQQHRAESPDVVALFTKFVNYLDGSNTMDLSTPESENVKYVKDFVGFKRGDRALAYTNRVVGELNQTIAMLLGIHGYEGHEIQIGNLPETMICEKIIKPTEEELLQLYIEGRLKLQDNQINARYLEYTIYQLWDNPNIEFVQTLDDDVYAVIFGIGHANQLRNDVKNAAANAAKGSKDRSQAWSLYYTINRAFTADHAFASTVHKSQGSEFDTVWIHKEDILKAIGPTRNYQQYARMMYVAMSRAKKRINIYG